MMEKDKDKVEESNENEFAFEDELFAEDNKKKKKMIKLFFIIWGILFLVIGILFIVSSSLFSKKDKNNNDKNIDYLINTYGENVNITFLNKKKQLFSYSICSKKTIYCVEIKYDELNNKWIYPNGENFVSVLLLMDQLANILDNNNIEYTSYTDTTTLHDIPNNFVLAIRKDDNASLIRSIEDINRSDLIDIICGEDGKNCNANYHITIFNKEDYDLIVSETSKKSSIKSYADLYEILLKSDDDSYGSKLGENIERHNIDDNMFSCNDDECNSHKHIAYRYVPGNHNHVGSTIIVEGIN